MGASNSVEAEVDHTNGNNHAQYEANMVTTTAAEAEVAFLFTIVDKMPLLSGVIISGILCSHCHTPLLRFSDAWIQARYAGGTIQTFTCILLAGPASYFNEIGSPDHPIFVVLSTIGFLLMIFWLVQICGILLGFEHISKCVIWSVGVLLLSMVLVWVVFQHQPMKVWLKWTKNALEWMLKWAKNAFEWMKAKISERLRDGSLPPDKGLGGITFRYCASLIWVLARFA